MTISAVQVYTRDVVTDIHAPDWQKGTIAYIASPVPGTAKLQQPLIFVWGASVREARTSIPRAAPGINPMLTPPGQTVASGWKERYYTISMWVYGVEENNDKNRDTKFPVLIEQVCNALRMAQVPAYLVDAKTGEQSKLMNIGEEFTWEYDVDRTLADQRMLRNACRLDVSVLEQFQF